VKRRSLLQLRPRPLKQNNTKMVLTKHPLLNNLLKREPLRNPRSARESLRKRKKRKFANQRSLRNQRNISRSLSTRRKRPQLLILSKSPNFLSNQ
jgi:hypothetical protein